MLLPIILPLTFWACKRLKGANKKWFLGLIPFFVYSLITILFIIGYGIEPLLTGKSSLFLFDLGAIFSLIVLIVSPK